ncbi:MAG: hypothetical protein ACXWQR_19945 [Ktedonobacterales bacterium]
MSIALRIETVVQPDGKIELNVPQLTPGQHVTVVIEAATAQDESRLAPRHVRDIIAELSGGQIFKTVEEVDAYIREERDSWER